MSPDRRRRAKRSKKSPDADVNGWISTFELSDGTSAGLDGDPVADGKLVARAKWQQLRVLVWEAWARDDGHSARPPGGAIHDGIYSDVLSGRRRNVPAFFYQGDTEPDVAFHARYTDAISPEPDQMVAIAMVGEELAAVRAFRRADPKAARSIRGPLKMYEALLKQAREIIRLEPDVDKREAALESLNVDGSSSNGPALEPENDESLLST